MKKLYWTYERCKKESLKYNIKKEFREKSYSCYSAILRNKWYELMLHMKNIGNLYNRCVYVYEFDDNYVYVGLTMNMENRDLQHKNSMLSSVFTHRIKTNIEPTLIKISEYIDKNDAIQLEVKTIDLYKKNGWVLLNKVKGGGLGATNKYWTKEKCIEESLKYNTKKEFREKSYSCYKISLKNKWLGEVTLHMISSNNPKGYWTKERCIEQALNYNTKKEFMKNSIKCYKISSKNMWLVEITSHMINLNKPKGYWTKEKCIDETFKYNTKKEFIKNSNICYRISQKKWPDINKIFTNGK